MKNPETTYPRPSTVNGHVPDIIAEKVENGVVKYAIGEVGSYEGIVSKEVYEQILAFQHGSSQYEFFFGVSSKGLKKAKYLFLDVLIGENEKDHLCHFDV